MILLLNCLMVSRQGELLKSNIELQQGTLPRKKVFICKRLEINKIFNEGKYFQVKTIFEKKFRKRSVNCYIATTRMRSEVTCYSSFQVCVKST